MAGRTRDKDGLTDKQRQAIPIIARAKSKHQGVLECERLGIVKQHHYYKHWVKEPRYVEKLQIERQQYFEEVREKVTDVFINYAEVLAQRLVALGLQDGSDRLRAIENVLTTLGFEFGRGGKVQVQTNVVQSQNAETFKERLRRAIAQRDKYLPEDKSPDDEYEEVEEEEE
jgi:hypothetical protein